MDLGMLAVKAIVLGMVILGLLAFVFWQFSKNTIEKDLHRLDKETEVVRGKQVELNEKIKQANEELSKRKSEADALVNKMKEDAEAKAREERDKIVSKARQEGEEIIVKANRTKDDIRRVLVKEFDIKAVDFVLILLDKVLSERGKGALEECMIAEFLENLAKVDMDMIGEDIVSADIIVASPLSESNRNRISDVLFQKLNRLIQINPTIDPKIVSGLVLKFGSLSLDGSLSNMIKDAALDMKEKIDKGLIKSE